MSKWIQFVEGEPSPSGKTKVWKVVSSLHKVAEIEQHVSLGRISWYVGWRRYCFFPSRDSVFEQACLRDIAQFCEDQTSAKIRERQR